MLERDDRPSTRYSNCCSETVLRDCTDNSSTTPVAANQFPARGLGGCSSDGDDHDDTGDMTRTRVAVIGAGAAGLTAARHLTASSESFECAVFEQTGALGGTWVYTDRVGLDQFGLPVHSSMYQGLTTNLPKEVMSYPDFPIVADEDYITSEQMLDYLNGYAEKFKLLQHIKFYQHVRSIKPRNGIWEITVINVQTKSEQCFEFDAVMVCNGHYSVPHIPDYPGRDKFLGEQIHCHSYRTPDRFQDKAVLIIGAGHSARDISHDISAVAKQVVMSHHLPAPITNIDWAKPVIQKPDVKSIDERSVSFADGTCEEVDVILYCTGYLYNFNFLDASCQIKVDNNYVQPLYKHMINIELPKMCIVGLPLYVSPLPLFDLQVRYFLKTLAGEIALPSREAMLADTEEEMTARRAVAGFNNRKAHKMGPLQEAYCNDLSDRLGVPRLPEIVFKRFNMSLCIANLLQ